MAFNGNGLFSRIYSWITDRNNGVKIDSTRMDTEMDGMAVGLSTMICRDGQSTITASIPFNNQKITGLADATASTDALNRQTADLRYYAPLPQTVSASTVDCSTGQTSFRKSVSGDLTWVFSSPPSGTFGFLLKLTNGGSGVQTWPASVVWAGGRKPTSTASGVDWYVFFTDDSGTTWYGSLAIKDAR